MLTELLGVVGLVCQGSNEAETTAHCSAKLSLTGTLPLNLHCYTEISSILAIKNLYQKGIWRQSMKGQQTAVATVLMQKYMAGLKSQSLI